MSDIQQSVTWLTAAVMTLDQTADTALPETRQRVAKALAYQWGRHAYGDTIKNRTRVTKHDVAVVLAALGATPFTIGLHAHSIAGMIRADFTDGMR